MSHDESELERLRRAFASREGPGAAAASCPPPERLWSAVRGELLPEAVRPLVLHTADCADCAEAWRLAREMSAGPAAWTAAPRRARARQWWGGWARLAAGTAAVAVAGAALLPHGREHPAFREGGSSQIRSLIPDSRPLPRERCLLSWRGGPDGATYTLLAATERLEPVAEARGLTAPEYLIPPEKLSGVPAGAKLLWRVEALAPGGARVASATFVTRLE